MGYFPVRYASRVAIYDRRAVIRLATGCMDFANSRHQIQNRFCAFWIICYFYLIPFNVSMKRTKICRELSEVNCESRLQPFSRFSALGRAAKA